MNRGDYVMIDTRVKCNTGCPLNYLSTSKTPLDLHSYPKTMIVGADEDGHPVNYLGERLSVSPTGFIEIVEQDTGSYSTHIKDSGERREFQSGAVRDIVEGKGRCDLVPLESAAILIFSSYSLVCDVDFIKRNIEKIVLEKLDDYMSTFNEGEEDQEYHLSMVVQNFLLARKWSKNDAFLEVSKHYEEGAKKIRRVQLAERYSMSFIH